MGIDQKLDLGQQDWLKENANALRFVQGFFVENQQERVCMNSIYDCVDSFKRLLHIAYIFILGRKGTHLELRVQFRKQECFHLMGLHYLKDKAELNGSSSLVFDKILKRQISAENIENSVYYTDNIAKRIHYLSHLEELLDSNDTVFKYDPKIQAFSVIDANV